MCIKFQVSSWNTGNTAYVFVKSLISAIFLVYDTFLALKSRKIG